MPKRVAITIAGAVSLGSYEAGVTYELLEAMRTHNEAAKNDDEKMYVDVITGASAGGMTAAMLAQRLMYNGAAMEGPFTNPLYHAWVERIDISELVKLSVKEMPLKWHSLLSSDLIEQIGDEMLVDSVDSGQPNAPNSVLGGAPHNVIERDPSGQPVPLKVGLALTNLNGVDYMLPIEGSDEDGFNYTSSVDQKLFEVGPDEAVGPCDGPTYAAKLEAWKTMRQAAVSCGAFPAAFRTQANVRQLSEYGGLPKLPPETPGVPRDLKLGDTYIEWGAEDEQTFAYCDGGVLQNQPLGIAKNFVDDKKKGLSGTDAHKMADDRLYVFVSPHSVKSSANQALKAEKITIADELAALVSTYMRQAMFHDWIVAEGLNKKVRVLDKNASDLAGALAKGEVKDVPQLLGASAALNTLLIPDAQKLNDAKERLRAQYAEEYKTATNDGADAEKGDAFLNALATLETSAQLDEKDTMKIVAVIADGPTELAGSGISAFAGFFSREYREHDYWMGRVKARVYLQRKDVKRILNVKTWPAESTWGGPQIEGVQKALPNPTAIQQLPMPFRKMIAPGLGSLLYVFKIRPAIRRVLVGIVAAIILAILCIAIVLGGGITLLWCWLIHLCHHGMLVR